MPHNPVLADQLPGEYIIRMRQQPRAARACGFGDRDRRCIDPPPILQLAINNPSITAEEHRARLHYPFYVVHCTLYDETGEVDCTYMPDGFPRQKRMMGNLASGPFVAKDEFGTEGCFFPFPDMSIRTPGEYRLKFSFVMLEPQSGVVGRSYSIGSIVFSDKFLVSSAKDFPGMVESSPLARTLKEQGYLISIRKGGDSRKGRGGRRKKAEESSDESDESSAVSPPRRKRKSVQ
ncbi:velvet factor-domain-containing protein [Plectosphaerella cucumerina]|uniref:Velvet factor-domain-containing protein n=1 Tax=Plectosphaerella cucumerina TaxID=40658 RepID=A0A8K0X059_9PEZI|nr:velvet factor-domain-containing protein [Plectosphaerella cucumerina]